MLKDENASYSIRMTRSTPHPAFPCPAFSRRLVLLSALLVLAVGLLLGQQFWLSPEARERRYSRMSLAELERRAPSTRDPLLLYYAARRRTESRDPEGAVQALTGALRLDPRFGRARATLGSLLVTMDRDQEASLQLTQAIRDDPANADAYLGLALLHQRHRTWNRQSEAAEAATRIQPDNSNAWILLGEAAEAQQEYARAAECFERAAAAAPADPRPHALAAGANLMLGRLDAAEGQARAAIRLGPKDPLAHLALGDVLRRRRPSDLDEAAHAYERAARMGDASGRAAYKLGSVYLAGRRWVEAEQQFRLALRADHALNESRYGLVRALRAQGRHGDAAAMDRDFRAWGVLEKKYASLQNRVALRPDDAGPWFELARLNRRMGLWEEAARTARSGLRRAPADAQGLKLLDEIERRVR